ARLATPRRTVTKAPDQPAWAVPPPKEPLPQRINYIGQFAVEFLRTAGIRCTADLPMQVPEKNVSTEVRHNLFLVVKEALNNIVSHSGANEVALQIVINEQSLSLIIEDNGRGFCPPPAAETNGSKVSLPSSPGNNGTAGATAK